MKYISIFLLSLISVTLNAQVINDLSNSDGLIIPKSNLIDAGSQLLGNIVYSNADSSVYFFNGDKWIKLNEVKSIDGLNYFIGDFAGDSITTGNNNIGIGFASLENDSSGNYNLALGHFALNNNSSGQYNVAIGDRSLEANKDGFDNIGIGAFTLLNGLSSIGNIAIGNSAISNQVFGIDNIGIGRSTMFNNLSGIHNISIGTSSLSTATSFNNNIAIGHKALEHAFNPNYCIAIGNEVGDSASLINNSIMIGNQAGYFNNGHHNLFLGNGSGYWESGSHKLYIHNDTSSSPLIYGEFDNRLVQHNGSTVFNPDSTDANILVSYKKDGSYHPIIKSSSQNSGYLGDDQNPFYKTYSRFFYAEDPGNYLTFSDRRLKENIQNMPSVLLQVNRLRPVTYHKKTKTPVYQDQNKLHYGLIAQEVEEVFPEFVDSPKHGMKAVAYNALIPVLVKAIQEQQKQIDNLKNQMRTMQKELN